MQREELNVGQKVLLLKNSSSATELNQYIGQIATVELDTGFGYMLKFGDTTNIKLLYLSMRHLDDVRVIK